MFIKRIIKAGETSPISAAGLSFTVDYASQNQFKIGLDDESLMVLAQGFKYDGRLAGKGFQKLMVQNLSETTDLELRLYISKGLIEDMRAFLSGAVNMRSGNKIETLSAKSVSTTAVEILPQDDDTSRAWIQNLGATPLYIGDNSVTTANGIKFLTTGQISVLDTAAAVWGVADSGTLDVRRMREKF